MKKTRFQYIRGNQLPEEKNIIDKLWEEAKRWKEVGLTFFAVTWLIKEILVPLAAFVLGYLELI